MVIICVSNTNGSSAVQEKVCLFFIFFIDFYLEINNNLISFIHNINKNINFKC